MANSNSIDIDMTPMIDIVFQLITFFMVVINFDAADADERVRMAISDLARPPKVKPTGELVLQMARSCSTAARRSPFNRLTGSSAPCSTASSRSRSSRGISIPMARPAPRS
jgi:biopolymer transport protein ExbD